LTYTRRRYGTGYYLCPAITTAYCSANNPDWIADEYGIGVNKSEFVMAILLTDVIRHPRASWRASCTNVGRRSHPGLRPAAIEVRRRSVQPELKCECNFLGAPAKGSLRRDIAWWLEACLNVCARSFALLSATTGLAGRSRRAILQAGKSESPVTLTISNLSLGLLSWDIPLDGPPNDLRDSSRGA